LHSNEFLNERQAMARAFSDIDDIGGTPHFESRFRLNGTERASVIGLAAFGQQGTRRVNLLARDIDDGPCVPVMPSKAIEVFFEAIEVVFVLDALAVVAARNA
jgi:hypothetical protein